MPRCQSTNARTRIAGRVSSTSTTGLSPVFVSRASLVAAPNRYSIPQSHPTSDGSRSCIPISCSLSPSSHSPPVSVCPHSLPAMPDAPHRYQSSTYPHRHDLFCWDGTSQSHSPSQSGSGYLLKFVPFQMTQIRRRKYIPPSAAISIHQHRAPSPQRPSPLRTGGISAASSRCTSLLLVFRDALAYNYFNSKSFLSALLSALSKVLIFNKLEDFCLLICLFACFFICPFICPFKIP